MCWVYVEEGGEFQPRYATSDHDGNVILLDEEDIRLLSPPEPTDEDIEAMYRDWCMEHGIDPDEPPCPPASVEPDDSSELARHVSRHVA